MASAGLQRRLSQGPSNTSGAVFYGNHMAVAMAMGFLFYGGGSASFSSSKEATAALVVSLFPKFPLSPTDNRSHIQVTSTLYPLLRKRLGQTASRTTSPTVSTSCLAIVIWSLVAKLTY